jgi:hypothetical protein
MEFNEVETESKDCEDADPHSVLHSVLIVKSVTEGLFFEVS